MKAKIRGKEKREEREEKETKKGETKKIREPFQRFAHERISSKSGIGPAVSFYYVEADMLERSFATWKASTAGLRIRVIMKVKMKKRT